MRLISRHDGRLCFGVKSFSRAILSHQGLSLAVLDKPCQHGKQWFRDVHSTSIQRQQVAEFKNLKSFYKELKNESKATRDQSSLEDQNGSLIAEKWRISVGVEIHAQLNTEYKLFSEAKVANTLARPNDKANVAVFDLGLPGAQPVFQQGAVIPAIRAALVLKCTIAELSTFDRKHYFYQDQPNGYQITQYYQPFARNGHVILNSEDGIEDLDGLCVGIQQIQLEQDTAKSLVENVDTTLLDFNRAGQPLIEIISRPDIHNARAAAAYVKKVQTLLLDMNAVRTGMEFGGLRADVNVSVAAPGSPKLGQRVEIKNLSTLQTIEAAVDAEARRQIELLENGHEVLQETRGWSLGSTTSTRLRGKEGEVDYRYMPDADLPALKIDTALVQHLSEQLPPTSFEIIDDLVKNSGLTRKDASTISALDEGARLEYFDNVKAAVSECSSDGSLSGKKASRPVSDVEIANWTLHELGALMTTSNTTFSPDLVTATDLARILYATACGQIDRSSAKNIFRQVFAKEGNSVEEMIAKASKTESSAEIKDLYEASVERVIARNSRLVQAITQQGQTRKLQGLIGMVLREADHGVLRPHLVEQVLREKLGLKKDDSKE